MCSRESQYKQITSTGWAHFTKARDHVAAFSKQQGKKSGGTCPRRSGLLRERKQTSSGPSRLGERPGQRTGDRQGDRASLQARITVLAASWGLDARVLQLGL